MRMRDELAYTYPEAETDNPRFWASEAGYFKTGELGLAEDAGESVVMVTPSGAPAATQAQQQPAQQAGGKPWYETLISSIVPVAANVYQQQQLNKLNMQRTQQGLPMISAADYLRTYAAPTATVQVGPSESAQRALLWGAGIIGGLVALRALKII